MNIINDDCIVALKLLPDNSVDSIVTDPPYHLTSIVKRFGKPNAAPAQFGTDGAFSRAAKGFMGKEWDGGDIAFRTDVWIECLRVLKPGGHMLSFGGSRTYHRMAVAIEDAGFDIRDQIMWIYGSGFPKSHNIGKSIDKMEGNEREVVGERSYGYNESPIYGTGITGNIPITKGNSDWEGWGTALKPAHEPIVMARKPLSEKSIAENVLKHGTGGINIDGCRVGNEKVYTRGKGVGITGELVYGHYGNQQDSEEREGRFPANIMFDEEAGKLLDEQTDGASRFFYCPKANKKERGTDNIHPTVKPIALMEYLIKLITPVNGIVLDPFLGSGTTGVAAVRNNFDFIGIEKDKEYYKIASKRIKKEHAKREFF